MNDLIFTTDFNGLKKKKMKKRQKNIKIALTEDIWDAVDQETIEGVEYWLEKHPEHLNLPGGKAFNKHTPLHLATYHGNFKLVEFLLNNGANIEMNDPTTNATALHWASHYGHLSIVKCLINNNAIIDSKDGLMSTPLHYATAQDNLEIVKYLIIKGANFQIQNASGQTSIDFAKSFGCNDCYDYFCDIISAENNLF